MRDLDSLGLACRSGGVEDAGEILRQRDLQGNGDEIGLCQSGEVEK